MEYRILKENEIKEAIELVARVAKKDIYKDFDQEGINSFNQVNCDTFYRNKQNLTYICLENKKIIGIITLTQGKHLSLLFVDNDYQGNGIGTKLFDAAGYPKHTRSNWYTDCRHCASTALLCSSDGT